LTIETNISAPTFRAIMKDILLISAVMTAQVLFMIMISKGNITVGALGDITTLSTEDKSRVPSAV